MNSRIAFRVGSSIAALTLCALFTAPGRGYAETQGGERRDDRQDSRGAGRDAKEECKDAGGKRIDCRQQKRDVKHGGSQDAPAAPQAAPAAPEAAPAAK
jgi:hypothetical protein